ncbi:MAG: leucine-rich repeat domain-containing protein [Acidobacteriota bacterium]
MNGKKTFWTLFAIVCSPALSATPVSAAIPAAERATLIALYNSTGGDYWKVNTGWKTPPLAPDGFASAGTEGSWYGITTDPGNSTVIEVRLDGNWLGGAIPADLVQLTNLQTLWLRGNQLTGNIPAVLGSLGQLDSLDLSANQLSGDIPGELGNLANLTGLDLSYNALGGVIPPVLGDLHSLRNLWLHHNSLTGSIPPELGNLANLERLWVGANRLEGEIPGALINLTALLDSASEFRWNALHTSNTSLWGFLCSKQLGTDWDSWQTVAPVAAHAVGSDNTSILVSWSPISYTVDDGGYRIYYSMTAGGPYALYGSTANKSVSSMTVSGLAPGTTYYFVADTFTRPHIWNDNAVTSERTAEFPGTTLTSGTCYSPAILTQPSDQTISSGQSATLSVGATGTAPLHYQWYKGAGTGTPVGTDAPSHITPPLTANAEYWVQVVSACGSVNSSLAIVTVQDTPGTAPKITSIKSKKGKPGAPASIYGLNFSPSAASNIVYFGKLKATPKKASTARLDVTIPAKCRSGRTYKVKVVSGGVSSNVVSFKVR